MKSRTLLIISIGLLILGIALFTFPARNQQPAQILPATINRDCAPWDGIAFTISIPYDSTTVIYISLWQSPSFNFPVTFSFPDVTLRVGTAYSVMELDPLEELRGTVSFERVREGTPVEGRFRLTSARGEMFEGRFVAEWGDSVPMCG